MRKFIAGLLLALSLIAPATAQQSINVHKVTTVQLVISGITGSTECLQANTSGVVSGTGASCSAPGGSSGQVEYNNSGALGGFTVGGDGTLNTGTGALTVTKTNGTNFGTMATGNFATPSAIGSGTPAAGSFTTLSASSTLTTAVTGSTQCLHVNSSGVISGTGTDCGSASAAGTVNVVKDGSTTVSGPVQLIFSGNGATVSNTAGNATVTIPAGGLLNIRVLTGSGTYTPTAGTNAVFVQLQAGGGSGAGAAAPGASAISCGAGGSAGGLVEKYLTSSFSGVSYAVGAGGAAPSAGANNGNNGNDTTFSTYTAGHGLAGSTRAALGTPTGVGGSAGGSATGGDINIPGGASGACIATNNANVIPGFGGSGPFGNGGLAPYVGGATQIAGSAGTGYGSGGSGGGADANGSAVAGGAGADGTIVIWEFR